MTDGQIVSFALGIVLMAYAFMFKEGVFRGQMNSRFKRIINWENLVAGPLPELFLQMLDVTSFWVISLMALFCVLNGILSYLFNVPIISMLFVVVAFPGVMLFRLFLIFKAKPKSKVK